MNDEPERARPTPGALTMAAIGIAAVGYVGIAAYDEWIREAPLPQRATEWVAGAIMAAAFGVSLRSLRIGGALAIATVGLELLASVVLESGDQSVKIVIPVLIVASGLMLGTRAATAAGVVFGGGAIALELFVVPKASAVPLDGARPLVVLALSSLAATLLTWTAVRAQERALEASDRARRRFHDLFQNAPEGLLALDVDGRILEANRRAAGLLGADDLSGRSLDAVLDELGVRRSRPVVTGTSEAPARLEVGAGPGARVLEAIARRLDERSGEGRAWLLVLLDTTERRALEEQLLHAQRLETVGLLAGGVAHDFNNILTAIGGNAELLADEGDEQTRELAGEILDAQRRGSALTRQLLAFARRDVRRPERIDLADTVRGMERLLIRLLGERHRLELRTEGTVPVLADRSQVEQVAVNLVTNARDASPPGATIRLEVRADAAPPVPGAGGASAALVVVDHGEGMTPATRARIFEPFFTTKARGRGTGLGLSTVHGIVTQGGGSLHVDTAPGRGTAVTVRLPLAPGAPERVGPAGTRAPPPGRAPGQEVVIVAEDDPGVLSLVVRTLRGAGYLVEGHGSGRGALQALAVAGPRPPALLLTDLAMPELDGPEVAAQARDLRPGLPVLFMTGYFDEARIEWQQVLRKPFTPEELLRAVADAIAPPGTSRAPGPDEVAPGRVPRQPP